MKKLLLILLCLPMIGFGQNVNIPDANFKAYLVGNTAINTNGDTEIQVIEATVFNGTIYCQNLNISDLTGIEDFTALTQLDCYDNQITSLDLSQNTALTQLDCSNNQLTTLDLSQNTVLIYLDCWSNQLTSLDVSGATAITDLYSSNNNLTSLDVSNNTALTEFSCSQNHITSLDVSNNLALTTFLCGANQLPSLDVSANLALTYLGCFSNQLTSLDLSSNTALTRLFCKYNQLTSLDLRNGNNTNMPINSSYINLTNNPDLYCIDVDNIIYSTTYWTVANSTIDTWMSFSTDCSTALGCTDSLACNYDSLATIDDGSCQLAGCIDLSACNYDVNAFCDDGSCIYINISVSSFDVSCNGYSDGGIVATATGGATPNLQYSLGGGLSQTNGTFSNLTAGTYFIDVTDINGCSSDSIFTITEPNPLFVNAFSTDISCFGYCDGSAFSMPSGGTLPYSYLWSNGNITDNISGLCAGAYVVNITDANNCVNIETVVISEPSLLSTTINVTDETAALNDGSANAIVLGGVPPYSYNWSNGSATNPNLNLSPGLYTVDVIDANGCIVSTSVTVNAYTTTDIIDIENDSKNLRNITDMLGQETPYRRNTPLFYIYDDGTVEKRIVIE